MKTSSTIQKISKALLNVQKEMVGVAKTTKNTFYKSNYADINSFLEVAMPLLNKEGVLLLQPPVASEDGKRVVETHLVHAESGEFIATSMELLLDKQDMQKLGSAITYARRYLLQALLCMQALDDDGEASMNRNVSSGLVSLPKNMPVNITHSEVVTTVNGDKVNNTVASLPKSMPVNTTISSGTLNNGKNTTVTVVNATTEATPTVPEAMVAPAVVTAPKRPTFKARAAATATKAVEASSDSGLG